MPRAVSTGRLAGLEDWLTAAGDRAFSIRSSSVSPDLCLITAQNHVHHYPTHIHDCVELIWIHSGWTKLSCRGVSYHLKAGDVCLVAPNEPHGAQVDSSGRCSFSLIHLPSHMYWSIVRSNRRQAAQGDLEPFRILRYATLGLTLNSVLDAFASDVDDRRCYDLLNDLLERVMLSRHSFASVRVDKAFWHPAVMHARQLMSRHCEDAVDLGEIAAQVGLNMRYFISLFKSGTGMPPHQYQVAIRVDKARMLLQAPRGVSLSGVAAEAGFTDQSHLSRHFKRSFGYTPGVYRHHMHAV
jgi:AraC-like DNA-binding protein